MQSNPTFHSGMAALPNEITDHIIQYVIADARPRPFGGSVTARNTHHSLASVSQTLRLIYLSRPHYALDKTMRQPRSYFRIGEVLEFGDLKTMAAFFQDGPGRDRTTLQKVRFISISYRDAAGWWKWTTEYAYETFEGLHNNWHHMRISLLQLHLPFYRTICSVDDPGVWSLLKIRGLSQLNILGPYGCIVPKVRSMLRTRTQKKRLFPWRPAGLENPWGGTRKNQINHESSSPWQEYYERLDARYRYLHDRETVTARHMKQRTAYHRRQRRYPMLSKRRKRC
jgi:hypothetical protein